MKSILLAALLSLTFASQAMAGSDYPYSFNDNRYASYFDKTLIFGHSISGNFKKILDYNHTYEVSPGNILTENYANTTVFQNISVNMGNMGIHDLGLGRLLLMQGKILPKDGDKTDYVGLYRQATTIIGVDAFYLGALYNTCVDTERNAIHQSAGQIIVNFIDQAYTDGKILILGNMPDEKFERMDPVTNFIITSSMDPDWKSCKSKINVALESFCKPSKNCYLVNLERIVNDMAKNEGAVLKVDGKKYSYAELRPDGANMSPAGTQLLVEDILGQLDTQAPNDPNQKFNQLKAK